MANDFTKGKGQLVLPPYASYVDNWNSPCNSDFGLVDALASGTTTINVTTIPSTTPFVTLVFQNFDVSPTPWQLPLAGQNLRIALTGSLSFNITVYIPANIPGMWLVYNQTTGAFTVTFQTDAAGSVGVTIPQNKSLIIFSDGVNVTTADSGNTPDIATSTLYGIVTQGLLAGNCVNLDSQAKIPYQTDKYIISNTTPDPTQGSQDWLWMQVSP